VTGDLTVASIESVFREEHGRLLATLVRQFRDLDLAEDVASEALEAALGRWPVDGVPRSPLAWLTTTARRKAVDRLRRDEAFAARLAILHIEAEQLVPAPPDPQTDDIPDERLRLFFTCSHPALSLDAQVALTLRYLGGLSTNEVARAFLVAETTMQQRIVRAKKKIRVAQIPFRVPERAEIADRLPAVLRTLYVIFTEGYAASTGGELVRVDLSEEAIRLARIIHRLLPAEAEVTGLLALFLLVDARRAARVGPSGELVPFEEQNRGLWDGERVGEGRELGVEALTAGVPGPYSLQAAIAALHAEADSVDTTDWAQIVALYDLLYRIDPSPVVGLNRAVAVAMRDTPETGLELLESLEPDTLEHYHLLPAARADLLRRMGRVEEAESAYAAALDLVTNDRERSFLLRRLAELPHAPESHRAPATSPSPKRRDQ
jgi:RNA polymerase sigma-70 factor (ECF subfamily)